MRSAFLVFSLAALAASCVASPSDHGGAGGASNGGTTIGKGGTTGTGGKPGTGGATKTGGSSSTGGSTQTQPSGTCADLSIDSTTVSGQYGGSLLSVVGSSKTYVIQANWWGTPYGSQTESISGLGFTMTSPNNVITTVKDTPLGFPSIFIGAYAGKTTSLSNLPKPVSALTRIPTAFSTNSDQKGSSNYNATYDVWFTANGSPLANGQSTPGAGGAYLMVWLFKPSDRSPRGSTKATGSIVKGVPGGWTVWYDNTNPPCVSYVSSSPLASLEFDLNDFIQDAVSSGYGITNSQYLSVVFAGFEVWGGGDGLQLKKFCANVE